MLFQSDTCGIVCTRTDYYTIPAITEIHLHRNGFCFVKDFTIGRMGYGNVCFPGETNVANLNIDKFVHFHRNSLTIYDDDDEKKPPIGQGLNRTARITLDNVFPMDIPKESNFANLLRRINAKRRCVFIDYRAKTGSWVFLVPHFTTYGFDKEDAIHKEKQVDLLKRKNKINVYLDRKQTDICSINRMKYLFYPIKVDCNKKQKVFHRKFDTAIIYKGTNIDKPKIFKLLNTTGYLLPSKSLIPKRGLMDMRIFKSNSYKIGWSKGFTLTTILEAKNSVLLLNVYGLCTIYKDDDNQDVFMNSVDTLLEIVLKATTIESNPDAAAPLATIKQNENLLAEIADAYNKLMKNNQMQSNQRISYYNSIFQLCVAFWGHCDNEFYRRLLFEEWLKTVNFELISEKLKEVDVLQRILMLLSAYKISDACELAIDSDYPRLALQLAQLPSSEVVKNIVVSQINAWSANEALDLINNDVIKLYLTFSGKPFCERIQLGANNLDWITCFAMHFWYLEFTGNNIKQNIESFHRKFVQDFFNTPCDLLYHILLLYCRNQKDLNMLSPETHSNNHIDYRLSWLLQIIFITLRLGYINSKTLIYNTVMFANQLESIGLYKWAVLVLMFIKDNGIRRNLILDVLNRNIDDSNNRIEEFELIHKFHVPSEWIYQIKSIKSVQVNKHWNAYTFLIKSHRYHECHDLIFTHLMPPLMVNQRFDILYKLFRRCNTTSINNCRGKIVMEFVEMLNRLQGNAPHFNELRNIEAMLSQFQFSCKTYADSVCYFQMEKIYSKLYALIHPNDNSYKHLMTFAN